MIRFSLDKSITDRRRLVGIVASGVTEVEVESRASAKWWARKLSHGELDDIAKVLAEIERCADLPPTHRAARRRRKR